jgi:hypothetical protein
MLNWISQAASSAFGWLSKNPEFTSQLLVGVGSAALGHIADQEQAKLADARIERQRPQYAGIENYTGQLTAGGGLLTDGLLAKRQGS